MNQEAIQPEDFNPYYAKVIGFVDKSGMLMENSEASGEVFDLLINVGEVDDVKSGERVLVFALGQEMKDPETGESLGCFEIVRGDGKVSSVQAKMAVVSSSLTKTVRYQRPQSINALVAGFQADYAEREERAPFRNPQIGDLVRFI